MSLSPQFSKRSGVELSSTDNFNGVDNLSLLFASGVYPEMGFTIKIDTSLGNGSNLFRTNVVGGTFTLFWGDGTAQVTNTAVVHTYSVGGQYEIAWRGTSVHQWNTVTTETSNQKLIDVIQWTANGGIRNDTFKDCDNITTFTATDGPANSPTTNIRVFDNCLNFNGDLSNWTTAIANSNSFQEFFRSAPAFNNNSIVNWDTSGVNRMSQLFRLATSFDQDISGWDVSSVTNFTNMFNRASAFDQDISGWDVTGGGAATNMSGMFSSASSFNANISGWDVSNNTSFNAMFTNATSFTQDLSNWDTSSGTSFVGCFNNCPVGDLTNWDVSNATGTNALASIFQANDTGSNPNMSNWKWPSVPFSAKDSLKFFRTWTGGDLTEKVVNPGQPNQYTAWDMSQCTDMHEIFSSNTVFNGDCSNWNVGNVLDLSLAFSQTQFDQDISSWNVANCTNMSGIFPGTFDQDLSSWNVGNVTNMTGMPHNRCGDTTGWDMSSVVFGNGMNADRDMGTWNLQSIQTIQLGNFQSTANKAKTMEGWGTNPLTNTGASAIPLYLNNTAFSKTATVGVEGYDGQAAYNGYLRLVAPTPNANRTSGTNTSTATDKLIDSGATFTASVNEGDVVANTTAGTYSVVETVDSDTQLTLADDIFTSTSQAYSVDGGFGWTITGINFS